jgi:hypothetical protein
MTFKQFLEIVNFLSPSVLFLSLLVMLFYYKDLDRIHKSISIYMILMLCIDISGRILKFIYGTNLILLPIYSLLELIVISTFYYKHFYKVKHNSILVLCFLAAVYIIWEIIKLNKTAAQYFQSYAKVVDNFVIITLALTYFHEKIKVFKDSKWDNFKLNSVILVFFFINMIFFLPINFLINESSGLKFYFWLSNLIITVSFYLYLTHCIWKNGRTRRLLPSGSR